MITQYPNHPSHQSPSHPTQLQSPIPNFTDLPITCLTNISEFLNDHYKIILTSLNKDLRNLTEYIYLDTPRYEHEIKLFKCRPYLWESTLPMPDTDFIIIYNGTLQTSETYPNIIKLGIEHCHIKDFRMFPNLKHLRISMLYNSIKLPTTVEYLKIDNSAYYGNELNINELVNMKTLHIKHKMNIEINLDVNKLIQDLKIDREIKISYNPNNSYPNIRSFKHRKKDLIINKNIFPNLKKLSCLSVFNIEDLEDMGNLEKFNCNYWSVNKINLGKFDKLKIFSGHNILIPKHGLKSIVDMSFDNDNITDVTDILYPKLRICRMDFIHNNIKVNINHDNLRRIPKSFFSCGTIRAPKLEYVDLTSGKLNGIKFIGKFGELTYVKLNFEKHVFLDFDQFPAIECLDVIKNNFSFKGVGKKLKKIRFCSGIGVLDFSEFEDLEEVMISGVLRSEVILGSGVKNVSFDDGLEVHFERYNFEENRVLSEKYLDISRCEDCEITDGGLSNMEGTYMGCGYDED